MLSPKTWGKNPSLSHPATGGFQQSLVFLGLEVHHSNLCLVVPVCLCLFSSLLIRMRVILAQYDLILTWHLQRPYFIVIGLEHQYVFLGGPHNSNRNSKDQVSMEIKWDIYHLLTTHFIRKKGLSSELLVKLVFLGLVHISSLLLCQMALG